MFIWKKMLKIVLFNRTKVILKSRKYVYLGKIWSSKDVSLETKQVLFETLFSIMNSLGDNYVGYFKWDTLYVCIYVFNIIRIMRYDLFSCSIVQELSCKYTTNASIGLHVHTFNIYHTYFCVKMVLI